MSRKAAKSEDEVLAIGHLQGPAGDLSDQGAHLVHAGQDVAGQKIVLEEIGIHGTHYQYQTMKGNKKQLHNS